MTNEPVIQGQRTNVIDQEFGNSYEHVWFVWYSFCGVKTRTPAFSGFQLLHPPLVRIPHEGVNE